jgi:hypothetical protein
VEGDGAAVRPAALRAVPDLPDDEAGDSDDATPMSDADALN